MAAVTWIFFATPPHDGFLFESSLFTDKNLKKGFG